MLRLLCAVLCCIVLMVTVYFRLVISLLREKQGFWSKTSRHTFLTACFSYMALLRP